MSDFSQEIQGDLSNSAIRHVLEDLPLRAGIREIGDNMMMCYDKMVTMSLVAPAELNLLEVWLRETSFLGY